MSQNSQEDDLKRLVHCSQEPASVDNIPDQSPDCSVAIINGRVVINHPPGGPYPIVNPCPELRLIVNRKELDLPVPLKKGDNVQVLPTREVQEGAWSITVSPDQLEVLLYIKPKLLLERSVKDLPPSRIMQLKYQEQKAASTPLSMDDLVKQLNTRGIRYGIDWSACKRALDTQEEITLVIARGEPPFSGRDANLEIFFTEQNKIPVKTEDYSKVDFREQFQFTSVEAGTVLAKKHAASKGYPGKTVTGEVVMPADPLEIELAAGQGCVISDDGLEAIATIAGRPVIRRKGSKVRISVFPALVKSGDVDISSGNISFDGDITITGQVGEEMTVCAGGNIFIAGIVSRADIRSGGSIEVKNNVFSATLVAGGSRALPQELVSLLMRIESHLHGLVAAVKQIIDSRFPDLEKLKKVGAVVLSLLESKFRELPSAVMELAGKLKEYPELAAIADLQELIRRLTFLVHTALQFESLNQLQKVNEDVSAYLQEISFAPQCEADITVRYAVSSTLLAANCIKVTGGGCYHSALRAGNSVLINGIFRGGKIIAGGDVSIAELGSRGGVATYVTTGAGRVVRLKRAFENTVVRIGERFYTFGQEEQGVILSLNSEGTAIQKNIMR